MAQSIHDKIDLANDEIERFDPETDSEIDVNLSSISEEVNKIDNEVNAIKDTIGEFLEQWKMKSFGEVEEFLEDTLSEIHKELGKISERLY